jgi:hypothetical protein
MSKKETSTEIYEILKVVNCNDCPLDNACDCYSCEYGQDFCSLLKMESEADSND